MLMDRDPTICFECEAEFIVDVAVDSDPQEVLFCPFCGSEVTDDFNEDDDEDEDPDGRY